MATLDFTQPVRSSIGFDQLRPTCPRVRTAGNSLSTLLHRKDRRGLVPHRLGVAGFVRDDIELVQEQNRLTIRGEGKLALMRHRLHYKKTGTKHACISGAPPVAGDANNGRSQG